MPYGIYHQNWKSLAARIRDRDHHECRICGNPGIECRLHVHHIDGDTSNNNHSNLVSLCKDCHSSVHDEGYCPHIAENEHYPRPWGTLPVICNDEWASLLSKQPKRRIGVGHKPKAPPAIKNQRMGDNDQPINTVCTPFAGSFQAYRDYITERGYVSYSSWLTTTLHHAHD